jgi:hypothetical protein
MAVKQTENNILLKLIFTIKERDIGKPVKTDTEGRTDLGLICEE